MKKTFKKVISTALAVILLLSVVPINSLADNIEEPPAATSGTCGDNVTWTFEESTGELTIIGEDDMYDYKSYNSPWEEHEDSITTIVIKDGVTTIGDYAFYSCDNLTSVIIGDSVISIGKYAFWCCRNLTSVTIGNGVATIGEKAFSNCSGLTSINLPDSLTTIGERAFDYCYGLTNVTIPGNVNSIGDGAFFFCNRITNITVDADNQYYCNDSYGVLYNKNKTELVQYPLGNERTSFVIPDSVITIGVSAFAACDYLTNVTIPDSVITIGSYAFYDCRDLTTLVIPDSVTSIGEEAFASCYNLTDVYYKGTQEQWNAINIGEYNEYLTDATIHFNATGGEVGKITGTCGDNLTWTFDETTGELSITGTGAMYNYSSAFDVPWCYNSSSIKTVTIADNVTTIGDGTFKSCYNLESVVIADSVTTIGEYAFYGCDSLASVTIPNSVTTIGDGAFFYCTSLTNITVGADNKYYSSDTYGVLYNKNKTELVQYPVGNKRTSFTIPDVVTTIGDCAFNHCDSLTNVAIPDSVTTIGNRAFAYCYDLTSVTIGNSVITIGEDAFHCCNSLTSVIIPDSVTTIGDYAFADCDSLTSLTIPDSVTIIGDSAFRWCTSLTSITVDADNQYYSSDTYGVLYNKNKTELIQYPVGNKRTSFAIPNGITTIGWGAFDNCYGLTSVTIPDSVTTIGECAFFTCTNLTSVTIPASVTIIERSAFGCWRLTDVYYNGTEEEWNKISIYEGNEELLNATIHFLGEDECTHSYTKITVPSTCKVQGMEYDLCSVCGNTTNSKVLPLAEHSWSEWTVTREATVENAGLEQRTCSACGDVESREIPKLEVIKDEETGVEIVYGDEYESGVEVEVTPVYDGNSYQIIESNYGNVNSKIFDISTIKDGQKVQPDGKVKVRIPVPADFNGNNIFVCYVDSVNGTVENIPATVKDGYIEFEAEHFSYYAILQMLGKVNSVDIDDISMNYKDSATITPNISYDEGIKYTVTYSSSDTDVATVDENGNIYATGKGDATITCTVTDEYGNVVTDTCEVEVKYTFGQWLIIIILFGWIWYI